MKGWYSALYMYNEKCQLTLYCLFLFVCLQNVKNAFAILAIKNNKNLLNLKYKNVILLDVIRIGGYLLNVEKNLILQNVLKFNYNTHLSFSF